MNIINFRINRNRLSIILSKIITKILGFELTKNFIYKARDRKNSTYRKLYDCQIK